MSTGTKTGRALRYVKEVAMKKSFNRKDAKDVVLLITDGRAYDDVDVPAKHLRDAGVEVRIIIYKTSQTF